MARRRLIDIEADKLGANPFLNGFNVLTREVADSQDLLQVSMDTGVAVAIGGRMSVERVFNVEQVEFTKLYRLAGHRKNIAGMPARAKELLTWLLYTIRAGEDYVVMNVERYKLENQCSHSTYLRAVDDLERSGVVMRTQYQTVLWLNPAYLFCGNRLEKYKELLVVTR